MNILFAGSLTPQRNGAARSSTELVTLLARAGHRVTAVAPVTLDLEAVDAFDHLAHPGVDVTRFSVPFFESLIHSPPVTYRRAFRSQLVSGLEQAIATQGADLILVGKEACVFGIPDLARRAGIPCAVASRGAILGLFDNADRKERVAEILGEMRKADMVIACAEHLADTLQAHGLQRVAAVVNAIDTARFRSSGKNAALQRSLAIPPGACVVAHASHLMPVKRPLDIVEAAAIVLGQDPRVFFLIVGGSSDHSLRQDMIAACRQRQILDRFRFVEWQDHDRIPHYLRLADLVVYPSASEGLCRGYLEAMACGRVLIASDIPAAREVIDDGVNGFLFPTGGIRDLARKIVDVTGDPALRRRIGRQARRTIVAKHTQRHWLAAHEAAFDQAIDAFAFANRRSVNRGGALGRAARR